MQRPYDSLPVKVSASLIALCIGLALGGCGGSSSAPSEASAESAEPEVTVPEGAPPKRLVVREIKKGTGPAAKLGDLVTTQWVGVLYKTGKEYYSTWKDHHLSSFKIGAGWIVTGLDYGVRGMRVGGRRELIVPPALGYEDVGTALIPPNESLVYVIELLAIK